MPIGNWSLEWLNHNSQRRYPLADDAEAVDDTGAFKLPNDFIVSLDLPIHAGLNVGPAGFFIRNVSAYAGGYGLTLAYQPADASDPVNVATALIPRQGFTHNSVFTLGGINDFSDTVGKVVIGRLENIDEQPPGFWEFSLDKSRLDPDAVRPIIRGVSSISILNGDQRSGPYDGDIEIAAGTNMQIVPIVQAGQDTIFVFNAISGEGTVQDCVCEGDSALTTPITKLNNVAPTNGGNFTVVGNDCLQVESIPNGIWLKDVCSQPCCGCAELERITTDLGRFASQATSVDNFVSQLQNVVDTMNLVVLGAKLNDRSCIQCE